MVLWKVDDRESVIKAIESFDSMGREAFLERYDCQESREYFLVYQGRMYDNKAIHCAAREFDGKPAPRPRYLRGGLMDTVPTLEALGFEFLHVPTSPRLPDWSEEELRWVRSYYRRRTAQRPSFNSSDEGVVTLSGLLRANPAVARRIREHDDYRTPLEVTVKIRLLWDQDHPAQAPRRTPVTDPSDVSSKEGEERYRKHKTRERSQKLARAKKDAVQRAGRPLSCEVCGFDSSIMFGEGLEGIIDVHHINPLSEVGPTETSLDDLALLCPTCHRAIHTAMRRGGTVTAPTDLKALVRIKRTKPSTPS